MADKDNSRSPTPSPRAWRRTSRSPALEDRIGSDIKESESRADALPILISAHRQPSNATHLSLETSDYLAAGDVHIREDTPQEEVPPVVPPPDCLYRIRTVHLDNAHSRLQEVLVDVPDEHDERWETTSTVEVLDQIQTRLIEDEVYTLRESMSIKFLKDHQVPLLYSVLNLRNVQYNPERYEGILRPFYQHPPMDFDAPLICFFERQSLRWQEFIRFQAHNRNLNTMDEPYLGQSYRAALLREATSGNEWRNIFQNWRLGHSQGRYEEYFNRRREEMIFLRDQDCNNFREYQAAVLARLDRNGVQRLDKSHMELPGFVLNHSFWDQDPMTTWTEYLAYEYWHMEQYDEDVDTHRPAHDRAYQFLQVAVRLREYETADFLPTEEATLQRRVELDEAYGKYDEAALTIARLEQRPAALQSPADIIHIRRNRILAAAQAELDAAEMAKNVAVQRNEQIEEFLRETATYREACDIRARHDHLLTWARNEYDLRLARTLAESHQETGASSSRPRVSFQLPSDMPAESATQIQDERDTGLDSHGMGAVGSDSQVSAAEVEPRSDVEARQDGASASCDASSSSAAAQPMLVETPAEEPVPVEQELVEQVDVVPPTVAQSPGTRVLSTAPAACTTDAVVPTTTKSLGPRRSARIAAMQAKAAEKVVVQSTQTSVRAKNLSRRAGASKGGRKRGASKVVAEEKAQDAEPPAKRTRRRTARK